MLISLKVPDDLGKLSALDKVEQAIEEIRISVVDERQVREVDSDVRNARRRHVHNGIPDRSEIAVPGNDLG